MHMGLRDLIYHKEFFVSICRCIKIALVHDMAECIVGDITPMDGITKEEKNKLEEVSTVLYVYIGVALRGHNWVHFAHRL